MVKTKPSPGKGGTKLRPEIGLVVLNFVLLYIRWLLMFRRKEKMNQQVSEAVRHRCIAPSRAYRNGTRNPRLKPWAIAVSSQTGRCGCFFCPVAARPGPAEGPPSTKPRAAAKPTGSLQRLPTASGKRAGALRNVETPGGVAGYALSANPFPRPKFRTTNAEFLLPKPMQLQSAYSISARRPISGT